MHQLRLTLQDRTHWGRFLQATGSAHTIFCPSIEDIAVGTEVRLKVVFVAGPQFFFGGIVTWRRAPPKGGRGLAAGVGVQVNASDVHKLEYVDRYIKGESQERRTRRRLPLRLKVTYSTGRGRRMNFTRDLTEAGLLLSAAQIVPVGTQMELTLIAPLDHPPVRVIGEVMRHVSDERGSAMGILLNFASDEQQGQFARLIRELERAFLEGTLPEQYVDTY